MKWPCSMVKSGHSPEAQGGDWRLWATRHSQGETWPLGSQPLPPEPTVSLRLTIQAVAALRLQRDQRSESPGTPGTFPYHLPNAEMVSEELDRNAYPGTFPTPVHSPPAQAAHGGSMPAQETAGEATVPEADTDLTLRQSSGTEGVSTVPPLPPAFAHLRRPADQETPEMVAAQDQMVAEFRLYSDEMAAVAQQHEGVVVAQRVVATAQHERVAAAQQHEVVEGFFVPDQQQLSEGQQQLPDPLQYNSSSSSLTPVAQQHTPGSPVGSTCAPVAQQPTPVSPCAASDTMAAQQPAPGLRTCAAPASSRATVVAPASATVISDLLREATTVISEAQPAPSSPRATVLAEAQPVPASPRATVISEATTVLAEAQQLETAVVQQLAPTLREIFITHVMCDYRPLS